MSDHYLILHPTEPSVELQDENVLITILHNNGLIAEPIEWYGQIRYKPGHRFFDLFEDVEGTIKLEYVTTQAQYTTRIQQTEVDKAQVIDGGQYAEPPHCPNCNYVHEEFGAIVSDWWQNPSSYRWSCPQCASEYQIEQLDWQHSMGFARYHIEIYGIGWHQVKPSKQLLDVLRDFADTEFSYVYQRY
jgi:hypothetical protein